MCVRLASRGLTDMMVEVGHPNVERDGRILTPMLRDFGPRVSFFVILLPFASPHVWLTVSCACAPQTPLVDLVDQMCYLFGQRPPL
jgi:hypothetical protein